MTRPMVAGNRRLGRRTLVALALGALTLAGCGATQPTRFYTLSGIQAPPRVTPALPPGRIVGVGPVTLPAYLDRPQIVTRAAPNRAELADFDSWVEPLNGMVPRILAEDLATLLGIDDVVVLPQRRSLRLAYQVEVDVSRFDVASGGRALLDARWSVYGEDGRNLLESGRATITETAESDAYGAVVAAMSGALGRLSHDIANAILAHAR